MRRTLFPSLAVPATFVRELKREALACECCCVFIHSFVRSFVHSFIHPFIHTSAPEPPASAAQQRLSFSFTSPLLSIRLSHTEHEVHVRTHTYGARGANRHRPLTGPVCEWEIFFIFFPSQLPHLQLSPCPPLIFFFFLPQTLLKHFSHLLLEASAC